MLAFTNRVVPSPIGAVEYNSCRAHSLESASNIVAALSTLPDVSLEVPALGYDNAQLYMGSLSDDDYYERI